MIDWVCDAEIDQVPFKDATGASIGRVHAGFYRQFSALFKLFGDQVRKHLADGGVLFCVGHSLAAAICAIAAVYYGRGYPGKVWYAGFGTPRSFDKAAAKAFDVCVKGRWRLKNCRDPVNSCLPPINYQHVGIEIHMGAIDEHPDLPLLIDIGDHDIKNYIVALQNGGNDKAERKDTARNWLHQLLKV